MTLDFIAISVVGLLASLLMWQVTRSLIFLVVSLSLLLAVPLLLRAKRP
jgi:hypothetical protein